jgi:hypothetical protein
LKKRNVIFIGGLSAISILLVIYYFDVSDDEATSLSLRIDSTAPKVVKQAHIDGLQWMGTLPVSATDKQGRLQTFGEEVDALTATRNPEDALQAYGIIEGCEGLRSLFQMDALPMAFLPQKKQCSTITDAMRRSMYDYLQVAASTGTPGVGSPLYRYGPFGDKEALQSKPNDPAVIEWKEHALALVIRDGDRGDINAIQDLMNGYAGKSPGFDADPSRAFAYALAYRDVTDLMDSGPVFNKPTDADLDALAAKLSPEQIAWAKEKAKGIVAARSKQSALKTR